MKKLKIKAQKSKIMERLFRVYKKSIFSIVA